MRVLYFASGSNRPADIRGFGAVGHAIGVAAPEVSPAAERELVRSQVPVFVDSGAFSEVAFGPEGVTVVRAITEEEWKERLALYRRLAAALGPRVSLVAPDRIGDQEETLRRLTRWAPELRDLRALGARILVPVQKGTLPQAAFVRKVEEALGFSDFVHAIPSKKKATTLDELAAYVREVKPARVHLLGLGIRNANARAVFALLEECEEVSCDSNLIAASVGRGGRVPRRLTLARDEAKRMIARGESTMHPGELAIRLAFGGDAAAAAQAIVTGEPVHARRIREAPFTFRPCAGHYFAANRLPGTIDHSHGFWRRWIVLTFNRNFEGDAARDPDIVEKILTSDRLAIVPWLLDGAARAMKQGGYTIPSSHWDQVRDWRRTADQVALFVEERCAAAKSERPHVGKVHDWTGAGTLYAAYRVWSESNGHRPLASNKFGIRMAELGRTSERTKLGAFYPVRLRRRDEPINDSGVTDHVTDFGGGPSMESDGSFDDYN